MQQDIYDPLQEYVDVFRARFKEVTEQTFAELAAEAKVDVEANKETCNQIYDTESVLDDVNSAITRWRIVCIVLWVALIVGGVFLYIHRHTPDTWMLGLGGGGMVTVVLYLFLKVYPKLRELSEERADLEDAVENLKAEAWLQMAPLNRLYDWDVLTRMMTKTVPKLEFDPYFTTQRLADLQMTYGWDSSFNEERSVIYSHSGLINGNPFVLCRTRKMEWGMKSYQGEKTIYWTTREQGSDGKMHTVNHSETLYATVEAPFPVYYEKTRLIYGNTAAPDLCFFRKQSGLAGKEDTLSFKWKKRTLRKKARNLEDDDFAMLTNEDFEVAFNTSNRNNNQQFALLFTPLAQESMLNLLKDTSAGYGDDFDFDKSRMINTIISKHMQELNLDLNPEQYHDFDYSRAKADFYTINARYFRAIYFCLAPLLCIPMYQQIRPQHDMYGREMQQRSAFWEHEALANFWGQDNFKHPNCVTDCILKTEEHEEDSGRTSITVYAHGHCAEQRLTYVSKHGGDGHWHDVPVYWDEYLPVTGTGQMELMEDNTPDNDNMTQGRRADHINEVLASAGFTVYRRHIASKV